MSVSSRIEEGGGERPSAPLSKKSRNKYFKFPNPFRSTRSEEGCCLGRGVEFREGMSVEELSEEIKALAGLQRASSGDADKLVQLLEIYDHQAIPLVQQGSDQSVLLYRLRDQCRQELELLQSHRRRHTSPSMVSAASSSDEVSRRPVRAATTPPRLDFGGRISIEAIDQKLVRIESYQQSVAGDAEGLAISLGLYDQIFHLLQSLAEMVSLDGSKRNLFEDRVVQLNIARRRCAQELDAASHGSAQEHPTFIEEKEPQIEQAPNPKSFDRLKHFIPLKITFHTELSYLDDWIHAVQRLSAQSCSSQQQDHVRCIISRALRAIAGFLEQVDSARQQGLSPPLIAQSEIEDRIVSLNIVSHMWN